MRLPQPPLLVITDRRVAKRPIEEIARRAFEAGCRWLSLRDKDLPDAERARLLGRLVSLGEGFGATVSCHGALPAGAFAQGLHLGRRGDVAAARRALGARALIGVSAHDEGEARAAAEAGADYVTFSPVFPSVSKPGYGAGEGGAALAGLTDRLKLPVLALGGVTPATAQACLDAGAAGLAVVGSVMAAEAPERAVHDLLEVLDAARFGRSPHD